MVKQLNAPTEHEIYNLLGTKEIESWTQEKVCLWLEEKGWGHFASTFESKCCLCIMKKKKRFVVPIIMLNRTSYLSRKILSDYISRTSAIFTQVSK
jgi:hypothetical protein